MTDIRKLLADALVQAAMEDDKSPKVTVSMRALEIMVGRDLRSLTMKDLEDFAEHASLCAEGAARAAGTRPASFGVRALRDGAGARLREARKAARISPAEIARHLKCSEGAIRSHENGTNGVPARVAPDYAEAYGVSPEWILFGRGEGPCESPKPAS